MKPNPETSPVLMESLDILPSTPTGTALTVTERAAVAIGSSQREIELNKLATAAKTITVITNGDGYKEANAQRIGLKNARTQITNVSKKAREDATAFSKSCLEEERRLIAIVEPEETRLIKLQDAWDAAIEAEKQRQIAAEQARVQAIKDGIDAIRRYPLDAVGKPSGAIRAFIDSCELIVVDDATFAEHAALAALTKSDVLAALNAMLTVALAHEAEQERVRLERIELDQLRARAKADDDRRAKEEQERVRREQEIARQHSEAEQASLRAKQDAERVIKLQQETDLLNEELERLRTANDERIAAEAIAAKAAPAPVELVAVVSSPAESLDAAMDQPSDEEIIEVIADHFDVSNATAYAWITSITPFRAAEALAA